MEDFGPGARFFFIDAFVQQEGKKKAADAADGVGAPGYQRRALRVRMRHVVGDIGYGNYSYAQAAADFVFCSLVILKVIF